MRAVRCSRSVRLRASSVLCAILVGACLASSAPARADTNDARSHFTRAVELFKEGDFRAALIEFQRAYDAAPNYKVLYNLGQTNLELQDYAGALKAFRGYLDGGAREIPAARRAQVEADLKRLESRVARVEIAVNVEGADVTVDDVSVGKSPLASPILVSAGRRRIAATKAGLTSASRVIDVAGGDKPKLTLELVEHESAPPQIVVQAPPSDGATLVTPPPQPPIVVKTSGGLSVPFYVSLAATGALAITSAVFGGLALSAKSTLDSRVAELGVSPSSIDSARSDVKTFALATDIFGGLAIAGAITTVVLAFTTSKRTVHEAPQARFFVTPFGVGVSGAM